MLDVSQYPVGKAITETGNILAGMKHTVAPAVLRFPSAATLCAFLATGTVPARPGRLETLGDPALTGMSRDELTTLIGRLAVKQAAENERRKYLQRGGHRRPTARAGIFQEKITDAERVLATILGLRKNCSWTVVAELFHVSRRTIGSARAQVGPLLEQDTCTITPASTRHLTATALLAAITHTEPRTDMPGSPC
jgi:hypothetical protein